MKILIVTPTPVFPTTGGNRARVLECLKTLESLGHEVHLLHIEREKGDVAAMREHLGERFHAIAYRRPAAEKRRVYVQRLLRRVGSNQGYQWGLDDWWPEGADEQVRALHQHHRFDAVLVEYIFLSRALNLFEDSVLKVIDTHDVFGDRYKMYLSQGMVPQWYSTSKRNEARALKRADAVIAIQRHEAAYYQQLGARRVVVVGHSVELAPSAPRIAGKRLFYLGADNPINVRSMVWFLDNVWPLVRRECADVECDIAGTICQALESREDLNFLGRVDDIAAAYEKASVVINPMLFGTGLKIKTIEALGMARPVVTTAVGAAGLEASIGRGCVVADDAADFAEALVTLLTDEQKQIDAGAEALKFAEGWNREVRENLAGIFTGR